MIPLKNRFSRRFFNFPAHAAYVNYASFLENFALSCLPPVCRQAGHLGLFERVRF